MDPAAPASLASRYLGRSLRVSAVVNRSVLTPIRDADVGIRAR